MMPSSTYKVPFERIKRHVLPDRERKADEGKSSGGELRPHHQLFLRYWWKHSYERPEMIARIDEIPRYIVCSGVTKRPGFNFIAQSVGPDHAVFAFTFADDYSFGVLQSDAHCLWFVTNCSKLKSDFRYTFGWSRKTIVADAQDQFIRFRFDQNRVQHLWPKRVGPVSCRGQIAIIFCRWALGVASTISPICARTAWIVLAA